MEDMELDDAVHTVRCKNAPHNVLHAIIIFSMCVVVWLAINLRFISLS